MLRWKVFAFHWLQNTQYSLLAFAFIQWEKVLNWHVLFYFIFFKKEMRGNLTIVEIVDCYTSVLD